MRVSLQLPPSSVTFRRVPSDLGAVAGSAGDLSSGCSDRAISADTSRAASSAASATSVRAMTARRSSCTASFRIARAESIPSEVLDSDYNMSGKIFNIMVADGVIKGLKSYQRGRQKHS